MSASYFDLLKYAATGQASPSMTYFDKMRASTLMGGTVKTLTGQPPLTFKADGSPLISWSVKGNGSQTGTPTPDNPVMPTFCGVRTANLFDINGTWIKQANTDTVIVSGNSVTITSKYYAKVKMPVPRNTDCVIKANVFEEGATTNGTVAIYESDSSTRIIYAAISEIIGVPFNTGNNDEIWVYLYASSGTETTKTFSDIMLNSGSTALPYEPFGYKIPITCAGQTTPVYLGEVPTVRRIKKLVLTGKEDWNTNYGITMVNSLLNNAPFKPEVRAISDRYVYNPIQSGLSAGLADGEFALQRSESGTFGYSYNLAIRDNRYTSVAEIKAYLAEQYAAGTPVVIWYVLANEETAIVNEPLCKIGTYADELSSKDAGVTIQTVKGDNVLTVDTELQPSEMTITYKG